MKNISSWLLQELLDSEKPQRSTIRELAPGDAVFHVGDPGDYVGVLLSGRIEIRKNGRTLSLVEPGSMFGEMGLIDHQPRMADAMAVSHCHIAEIREGQFMALLQETPHFALAVMRLLTERLRSKSDT